MFAEDLAELGNGLPDRLKAQLLSLSIFSIKHSYKEISSDSDMSVLVDVNTAMMKALREG